MATHQINKNTHIWTKFRSMGNVSYDPITNEFLGGSMLGMQDRGTLIVVKEFDGEHSGTYLAKEGFLKYWVPAITHYESNTRNQSGGLGAYRDIEDIERVNQIVKQLKNEIESNKE